MRTIRLVVEYDGSGFSGWQRQPGHPSVQGALETAVRRVTGRRAAVCASGRTDAGVHAEGQVASFRTASTIPADRFRDALNAHLPEGVAVVESDEAPTSFHPRKAARSKLYRYEILNRPSRPALDRARLWWVRVPLDVPAMRRAARALVGRRDFRSFASEADRYGSTVRTIRSLRISAAGDRLRVEVEGDGFLYNMVRAIVGTLVQVGRGKMAPAEVKRIVAARDRAQAGPTAPAAGLTLVRVDFS